MVKTAPTRNVPSRPSACQSKPCHFVQYRDETPHAEGRKRIQFLRYALRKANDPLLNRLSYSSAVPSRARAVSTGRENHDPRPRPSPIPSVAKCLNMESILRLRRAPWINGARGAPSISFFGSIDPFADIASHSRIGLTNIHIAGRPDAIQECLAVVDEEC